ncbi:MAG: MOSC domain-containing protein [Candidatus Melainabacteria bacterium]|nr:MOSC domain-containing protein [Candidatus Melainabacteria bacterium]
MPHPKLIVTALHYYPIKSCAGIAINSAEIGARGIKDDRGWLVVDAKNRFVTQREIPKMALIKGTVQENGLARMIKLEAPGLPPLLVPEAIASNPSNELADRSVVVWDDTCNAIDQGDEAANWLTRYLGKASLRLVRMEQDNIRPVKSERDDATESRVAFQDGYPFLILTSASLDELNRRLEQSTQTEGQFLELPLPMDRFRPNIVIEGAEPFAEDDWKEIRIGDVVFELDSGCPRCTITTVNQKTADRGIEPLKTLAKFRKTEDNKVMFGQNAIHRNSGAIKVGDEVAILK